jgi:hypothetical protein
VTRATQVLRRDGPRWVAEATFDPLNATRAGQLQGLTGSSALTVHARSTQLTR